MSKKINREKMYFNKSKPRPKFVQMEVSPEFVENFAVMKVATRRFCSKSLWTYMYISTKEKTFCAKYWNGKKGFCPG